MASKSPAVPSAHNDRSSEYPTKTALHTLQSTTVELERNIEMMTREIKDLRTARARDKEEIRYLNELRHCSYREIDDLEWDIKIKELEAKGMVEDISGWRQRVLAYSSTLWRYRDEQTTLKKEISDQRKKIETLTQDLEKAKVGQAELFSDLTTLLRLIHDNFVIVPDSIRAAMRKISERIVGPWGQ
ncbi:hypothetical protein HDK77DRAFT_478010 [Phyllosticta capitalensis]|uniref:Uncharacterized protein n=1 Tax=Phyllosticta capitalensis TaxID=121624 RepID=A0ABR1Y8Z1_9PEZI